MPKLRPRQQARAEVTSCRICELSLPLRNAIDKAIYSRVPYSQIIAAHANEVKLTAVIISRHKTKHTQMPPDRIPNAAMELAPANKAAVVKSARAMADDVMPIPTALRALLAIGIHNAVQNPALVTPQVTIQVIDLMRKLGLGSEAKDAFSDAWGALGTERSGTTKRTRKRVTVEEEEITSSPPEPVEAETIDGEWIVDDRGGLDTEEE